MNDWHRVIRNMKENCKHLKVIQFVASYNEFDNEIMDEMINTFPRVQINVVIYNYYHDTYKVEAYKRMTKTDRINPF